MKQIRIIQAIQIVKIFSLTLGATVEYHPHTILIINYQNDVYYIIPQCAYKIESPQPGNQSNFFKKNSKFLSDVRSTDVKYMKILIGHH